MQRVEEFLQFVKSNANIQPEEVLRVSGDLIRELKKYSPAELDGALSSLDFNKHAFAITVILCAKATNPNAQLDKLLQQVESFLSSCKSVGELPRNLNAHQIFTLMQFVYDRLIQDNMPQLGLELFKLAIGVVKENDNQLTEIHSLFLRLCLESQNLKPASDLLLTEVYEIPSSKHCDIQSYISYFFHGSVVLASYRYFISALRYIETIFYVPGCTSSNSQIVADAYKKYLLLLILAKDKATGIPRPLAHQLEAHLKKSLTPYVAFQERFMAEKFDYAGLENIASQHANVFSQDRNMPLITHCLKRYKVKELLKYAKVFENMEIAVVMQELQIPDVETLESLLLDMYSYSGAVGRLDMTSGMILFSKKTDNISTEDTVNALQHALTQMRTSTDAMWNVEKEILSDPDYLKKFVQGDGPAKDDLMSMMEGVASSGNGFFNTRSGRRTP